MAQVALQASAMAARFHQGYLRAASRTLISRSEWMACASDDVDFATGEQVYLGLDLSSTTDLTALIMVSASDPARVRSFFWKPADTLREHSNRDFGAGNQRYVEWLNAKHLFTTPGRSIDPAVIATFIAQLVRHYRIRGLAYDRWRCDELLRELDRIGLAAFKADSEKSGDGLRLIPCGQGYRDMAPAIDALEIAIMEGKIVHENSPVLNWNLANAVATTDPAGNRKLDKERAVFRIDGAVALAMAMGLRARDRGPARVFDPCALIG
jgi:phage terminase large subunit-like protein